MYFVMAGRGEGVLLRHACDVGSEAGLLITIAGWFELDGLGLMSLMAEGCWAKVWSSLKTGLSLLG